MIQPGASATSRDCALTRVAVTNGITNGVSPEAGSAYGAAPQLCSVPGTPPTFPTSPTLPAAPSLMTAPGWERWVLCCVVFGVLLASASPSSPCRGASRALRAAAPHSVLQHPTAPRSTPQYPTAPYHILQNPTASYNTP